jgi:gliding motility-associated lipoprotein GldD
LDYECLILDCFITAKFFNLPENKIEILRFFRIPFLSAFYIIFLSSCEKNFVPKPKGYHRIDLPAHEYQKLSDKYPYSFNFSTSAVVKKHQSAIAEENWIDIYYPEHRATIQLTYKNLSKEKLVKTKEKFLNELVNDSYKLTSKHQVKAYAIDESIVKTPKGKSATIFELEGDVPSQFQFYMTDTTKHFIRGALYFRTSTKNDSLKPVIEYIKIDMMEMINSWEWRE